MRKIKFRTWNKFNKKMLYEGFDISPDGNIWINQFSVREQFILMQYIGLEDKNGIEIYEGDIVVTNNNGKDGNDICEAKDWGNQVVTIDLYGVNLGCFSWDDKDSVNHIRYVSIIGNIHENPELLDK